jgi:hypothetical protein
MPSSEILRRVALGRTDVVEERGASIIRMTRIGEPGATLAVTSNWCTLRRNTVILLLACFHIKILQRAVSSNYSEQSKAKQIALVFDSICSAANNVFSDTGVWAREACSCPTDVTSLPSPTCWPRLYITSSLLLVLLVSFTTGTCTNSRNDFTTSVCSNYILNFREFAKKCIYIRDM